MTVTDPADGVHERPAWMSDIEHRVSCAAGVRNAADGALVALAVEVLVDGRWEVDGIHSPVHWFMWRAGLSRHTARQVIRLATRAADLPITIGLLVEGKLSLDQATTVARYTPGEFEAAVCEIAVNATVNQITAATREYDFDTDTPKTRVARERGVSFGTDDDGSWWARVRLAADEGKVVEEALKVTRDRLHREACRAAKQAATEAATADAGAADAVAGTAEAAGEAGEETDKGDDDAGPAVGDVSWADALVGMANAIAATDAAGAENGSRAVAHLHLEHPVEGCGVDWRAELHGGPRLPDALRRYLLCDCDIEIVWTEGGVPVSVGRSQRTPPRRLRRLVEHRDRHRCRVPGCDRSLWLQVHHIVHWEDGGPTDSHNLICICSKLHRLHHDGGLGITGNADAPGGLTFTNRHGLVLDPAGHPSAPRAGDMPRVAPYDGPTGEWLHKHLIHYAKTHPRSPDNGGASGTGTGTDTGASATSAAGAAPPNRERTPAA